MGRPSKETTAERLKYMLRAAEAQRARKYNTRHPLYSTWSDMRRRCNNPTRAAYQNYGGRGIKVCEAWENSFQQFCEDMGPKPGKEYSLERKDNDAGYGPDNCIWATVAEQNANKRQPSPRLVIEYEGRYLTVRQWAHELGVTERAIWRRWQRHGSPYNPT